MLRLAAIVSFILAFVFYVWSITHGKVTWIFFVLLGFIFASISSVRDFPALPAIIVKWRNTWKKKP